MDAIADTSTGRVAGALAKRGVVNVFRVPGAFVPILAMPVFFLIAFSGSFSGVTRIPGFPTDIIQNWTMPFAMSQGAAFAGLGSAFGVARDLEGGFYDRLLLSPAPRRALLIGPVLASMSRALVPVTIVLIIGFAGGARLTDGPAGLVPLIVAAESISVMAALWGLGIVYRLKSQRSMALVQVGIFITMFLTVGQVPLNVMTGWLHSVARLNPMTNILRLARQGLLPPGLSWDQTWGGLVAIFLCVSLLALWAWRGLRKLV